jgi:DNA modification methylase
MEIRDRIKELRRVVAAELQANPKNWREHPEAQRTAVRGVLEEIGYADALIAREDADGTLVIIDGHLRAETTPDCVVPVLVIDVSEEEADKILLTLDPLASMAECNSGKLKELTGSVTFSSTSLQKMVEKFAAESDLNKIPAVVSQDDAPLPADEAKTKPGNLWILGNHRLLCGDSSSPADLDRLLGGAKIQLVNTDPPYNVKVEPRSNNAIAAGLSSFGGLQNHQNADVRKRPGAANATQKKMRAKDRPLANDFVTDKKFDELLAAWFGNIARVLEPGRGFYIWGGYSNCGNYPPALEAAGLYFSQTIIWVKEHPVLTRKDLMGNHEWCFYGWKDEEMHLVLLQRDHINDHAACFYGWREGAAHKFFGPPNATDVWTVKKVSPQKMVHLTEKPVELAGRAIQYSSRPGENVLDLFGGSGSTLVACEETGRNGFLMELDPAYCDVIVERWEKLTGKKATLEGGEAPAPDTAATRGRTKAPAKKAAAKPKAGKARDTRAPKRKAA